ncbi:unnamed protein product [Peronospora belbahrii]|uniref:Uncharacterized protein n=1 Tax=Peronospora belbahrii TaxID=622444 RepID=A0ABN8CLZ2_9STRA|nr:unnamed protein product [Peronospora belbahrii]
MLRRQKPLGLPPLIIWHQLYSILPNRTFVDQNVHRLRKRGQLITFKISTGTDDVVILRTEDYVTQMEKYERVFREQLCQHSEDKAILCKLNAMVAFRQALAPITSLSTAPLKVFISTISESGEYENDQEVQAVVRQIQRLGFLIPTTRLDDEAFFFSVPGIGKLISAIKKTRTLILGTLKRVKYKEVLEQQLKKIKLKHSRFQLEFHLADMEGCGLIRRTKVTSGILVTLNDM